MILRLLVTGAALAAAASATAAPRGLTIEDLASMDRVGSPALSPDASRVVYTVRSTNLDKNKGITQLWMLDLKGNAAPRQLTSHDASSFDPEWSATGDAVYFLSGRSGSSQVWRLPLNGGEAVRVTDLPVDVDSFHVSPKGDRLAVTLAVFRDCADLSCTKKRADDQAKNKATGKLYDQMFVRHWDTWADGRRKVL
jgi:dipeptidyl aminopeptidase/acylaminoacyl peptidase